MNNLLDRAEKAKAEEFTEQAAAGSDSAKRKIGSSGEPPHSSGILQGTV